LKALFYFLFLLDFCLNYIYFSYDLKKNPKKDLKIWYGKRKQWVIVNCKFYFLSES